MPFLGVRASRMSRSGRFADEEIGSPRPHRRGIGRILGPPDPGADEDEIQEKLAEILDLIIHKGNTHPGLKILREEFERSGREEYACWVAVFSNKRGEEPTWFQKALAVAPGYVPARYGLARHLYGSGEGSKALAELDLLISVRPDFVPALALRAYAKASLRDLPGAMKDAGEAVRLDPEYPLAHMAMADFTFQSGSADVALKHLERTLEFCPSIADAYELRARILESHGRLQEAESDYSRFLELHPKCADGYYGRGRLRWRMEHHREALEDLDEAIRLSSDRAEMYSDRGMVKERLGKTQEAIADFTEAIRRKPGLTQAHYNRGSSYLRLQKYKEALVDLDRSAQLDGGVAIVYLNRGIVRSALSDSDGALQDFSKALELQPGSPDAYLNRGDERRLRREHPFAILDFLLCLRHAPVDWVGRPSARRGVFLSCAAIVKLMM